MVNGQMISGTGLVFGQIGHPEKLGLTRCTVLVNDEAWYLEVLTEKLSRWAGVRLLVWKCWAQPGVGLGWSASLAWSIGLANPERMHWSEVTLVSEKPAV